MLLSGCSAPSYRRIDTINCYYDTTEWGHDSLFAIPKSQPVTIDFKNDRINNKETYLADLKGRVEDYLLRHPEITGETKSALENFKVIEGMTKEQVKLLLGNPERIQSLDSNNKYKADERWVYIMKGLQGVYVGPVPIFLTHNAYHLYFKVDILSGIEDAGIEYL